MPGFDDKANHLLSRLREDYQSGATALALKTLRELAVYAEKATVDDLSALLGELRNARPSMIVIGNALARVESQLAAGERPLAAINQVTRELENASAAIAQHAHPLIPASAVIMTHSASSVVLELFRLLVREQHSFSVICTQSSPGLEGHPLARALYAPEYLLRDSSGVPGHRQGQRAGRFFVPWLASAISGSSGQGCLG